MFLFQYQQLYTEILHFKNVYHFEFKFDVSQYKKRNLKPLSARIPFILRDKEISIHINRSRFHCTPQWGKRCKPYYKGVSTILFDITDPKEFKRVTSRAISIKGRHPLTPILTLPIMGTGYPQKGIQRYWWQIWFTYR